MEGVMPETKIKVGNVYRYAPKRFMDGVAEHLKPLYGFRVRIIEGPPGGQQKPGFAWVEGALTGEFMGQVPVSDLIEVA
jgi:hypothetical protein